MSSIPLAGTAGLEPGQVEWLGLAAGYGQLPYRPSSQPIPCDRAVRVEFEKLYREE